MARKMREMREKVVLISGGGDEVGTSIAAVLGKAGARVVLADASEEQLARAQLHLREQGIEVLTLSADPADRLAMRAVAEALLTQFGKIHILIANAQQEMPDRMCDTDENDWEQGLAVNLGTVVNLIQEFLPMLCRHDEGGAIMARVPLASLAMKLAPGPLAVQGSAVVAIMEALSAELRGTGVTSSLLVGPIDAPATTAPDQDLGERVLRGIAAGDLYIFSQNVPAAIFHDYFDTLIAAIPTDAPAGAPPGSIDPDGMFPVYATVLRKAAGRDHKPMEDANE